MFGDFTYLQSLDTPEKNCNISCRLKMLSSWNFLTVKVDGNDVNPGICFVTPGCFNVQTSHEFENFCSFSSNGNYSVENQVIHFQYVKN